MYTELTILDRLRTDQTPYWYLYDGSRLMKRNRETPDLEQSIAHLSESLAQLPSGTYRLKAANHLKKHNGAAWHDLTISSGQHHQYPTPMNPSASTNAYNIPDHIYLKIQEEERQKFMFNDMYAEFKELRKEWPEYKAKVDKIEKFLFEDADGDGVSDFAETMKTVASAADSASTVKKVFTGSGLFG
ncbi:hypothetical protein [Spirosoma areae]